MRSGIRRATIVLGSVGLAIAAGTSAGCKRRNLASKMLDGDPRAELSAARCGGEGSTVRPLIIEWSAADRAALEARMRRGLVVVRYEGCQVEVLRSCSVEKADYRYVGITRKNDVIRIKNSDELYARLPLTAAKLEGRLAKAGELSVAMSLVGQFETDHVQHGTENLAGHCEGATHVVTAAQSGAFELHTGESAEIGLGLEVTGAGAGVGGRSEAEQQVLSRDGDPAACERSATSDQAPPEGCGGMLRLELVALNSAAREACPEGAQWNGSHCQVQQVYCPQGSQPEGSRCVAKAVAPSQPDAAPVSSSSAASRPSQDGQMCRQFCERGLSCEGEMKGVAVPEGKAFDRLIRSCMAMCTPMLNDYSRPQLRMCMAKTSCEEFTSCATADDGTDDPFFDDDW